MVFGFASRRNVFSNGAIWSHTFAAPLFSIGTPFSQLSPIFTSNAYLWTSFLGKDLGFVTPSVNGKVSEEMWSCSSFSSKNTALFGWYSRHSSRVSKTVIRLAPTSEGPTLVTSIVYFTVSPMVARLSWSCQSNYIRNTKHSQNIMGAFHYVPNHSLSSKL